MTCCTSSPSLGQSACSWSPNALAQGTNGFHAVTSKVHVHFSPSWFPWQYFTLPTTDSILLEIYSFFCFPNSTCSRFSPNFVAISRQNQSVFHPPPTSLCKIYSSSVNTLLLLSQSLTVVLTLLLIPDPFANLRKSMDPAHRKYLYTGFCIQFQGVNPNTSWRKKPALHMFSG